MKPIMQIELDELIEYRDELTNIINQFEKINARFDKNLEKLETLGIDEKTITTILDTLFEHGARCYTKSLAAT